LSATRFSTSVIAESIKKPSGPKISERWVNRSAHGNREKSTKKDPLGGEKLRPDRSQADTLIEAPKKPGARTINHVSGRFSGFRIHLLTAPSHPDGQWV
jgi:hypothetical protein